MNPTCSVVADPLRSFRPGVPKLLCSLGPNVVVVDGEEQTEAAAAFAQETGVPPLYRSVCKQRFHVTGPRPAALRRTGRRSRAASAGCGWAT